MQNCIKHGGKKTTVYRSTVEYHNNAPRWNETIHLVMTPFELERAVLWFSFAHCSLFAAPAAASNGGERPARRPRARCSTT